MSEQESVRCLNCGATILATGLYFLVISVVVIAVVLPRILHLLRGG